jgi:hypothetical protein
MVANWEFALPYATGDYVCYLTDKMFVLPDALHRVGTAIDLASNPDMVTWTADAFHPDTYDDYFGSGTYVRTEADLRSGRLARTERFSRGYRHFDPGRELDRRGRAAVARQEQSASDYCRGKLAFGAYSRDLIGRIIGRNGTLFRNISPDYTSMVLGLAEARDAVELDTSCVVQINTDISNGTLCDTHDDVALRFLNSLEGGAEAILPNLPIPGLYASLHNWVAHDYDSIRTANGLTFAFDLVNWLVYSSEDIHRPEREWSNPEIEAEQKDLLRGFLRSVDPAIARAVEARLAKRARARAEQSATVAPALWYRARRAIRRRLPSRPEVVAAPSRFQSITEAVTLGGVVARI